MTIRQITKTLQEQGHKVTYYVRRDGGILIKSIDGQRFTGATGNIYARAMTGQTLATKRATQLSKITWSGKRTQSYIEDREIKNVLRKVQRKWNKAFPHKRGETPEVGLKTAKKVRWTLEHKGREETLRLLEQAERYASGKAYSANIEHLIERIDSYIDLYETIQGADVSALKELKEEILAKAFLIEESSILPVYEKLYELNHGANVNDVVNQVRRILKFI